MSSRRTKHAVLLLIISLFTVIFTSVNVFADGTADSGVSYKISEDGTYIIIEGYDDILPNVKIESEIEGLPVKEIAESAFQNRTDIISVTIPDSIEKIGEAAFKGCTNLRSVTLPASLKEIPYECFRDCEILSSVTLPETLTKIDDRAFYDCTMIGRLSVPASVTEIGYDAFCNCESILLDCSQNDYAREYAARFNINTEFKGTSLYFFLMMLLGTAICAAIVIIIFFIYRRVIVKVLDKGKTKK